MSGKLYLSYFHRYISDPPDAVRFSIVRRILPFVKQLDLEDNLINLAPPDETLDSWKANEISWAEYTRQYITQLQTKEALSELGIITTLLDEGVDVIVYCYCGKNKGKHCHRYILGDVCHKLGYKVIDCINM